MNIFDLFESNIKKSNSGCWDWIGPMDINGYGRFYFEKERKSAHRVSLYLYKNININPKKGYECDHLCRNRRCVNPDHLEEVTKKENLKRGEWFIYINSRKTHCKNGHIFNKENTYEKKNKFGNIQRECRICRSEYRKLYKERTGK